MGEEQNAPTDLGYLDEIYGVIENLAATEEHFLRTMGKTGDTKFAVMASEVRKIRSTIQQSVWRNNAGECWCIGKHLPLVSVRMMETAMKATSLKKFDDAKMLMKNALEIKTLWMILAQGEVK